MASPIPPTLNDPVTGATSKSKMIQRFSAIIAHNLNRLPWPLQLDTVKLWDA